MIPPLTSFASALTRKSLRSDVIAGMTSAAVVLPKAMGYATLAGLPVQVGLYTAFVPMIVYAVLGTSLDPRHRNARRAAGSTAERG